MEVSMKSTNELTLLLDKHHPYLSGSGKMPLCNGNDCAF